MQIVMFTLVQANRVPCLVLSVFLKYLEILVTVTFSVIRCS